MRKLFKRLILILAPLILILAFQNCQKKKTGEPEELGSCATGDSSCTPSQSLSQTPMEMPLMSSTITVGFDMSSGAYKYELDLQNDRVINLATGAVCNLNKNSDWFEAKNIFLENGLCHYKVELSNDVATCMAMPLPFALVNFDDGSTADLIKPICLQNYTSLCGENNDVLFLAYLEKIISAIDQSKACQ